MNRSAFQYEPLGVPQTNITLNIAIGGLVVLGFVWGKSLEQLVAYLVLLCAAVLPSLLWLRMGAPGIPVLPAVGLAYIPYFAWPMLSGNETTLAYTNWEMARSGLTVALYLITASIAWRLIASKARTYGETASERTDWSRATRLLLVGIAAGLLFHVGAISQSLGWAGPYFGLVRSVALTFSTVACFLTGITRAKGVLRGKAWGAAIAGVGMLIALSWSSLFLVGGMIYALATTLGYVIVAKRVPWLAVGAILVAVTILHAGKSEMRDRYWGDSMRSWAISPDEVPALAAEWVGTGLSVIASGDVGASVIDRTSLLQMMLRVQSETPDRVGFLEGETYALLPATLVPRFIDADKPASQVGMDLLNIRYGLLTLEGAASTAIGWGLVAEAYANFGYYGVVAVAALLGACCGALLVWSANAELVSVPTLISIATLMLLLNLELDFVALFTSIYQSIGAVLISYTALKMFAKPVAR